VSALYLLRSGNVGPPFEAEHDGDTVLFDLATRKWRTGSVAGGVSSVFGRTGAVVAQTGDYDSDQVDNLSSVPGSSVSDALDYLLSNAGAVDSVFGRTGVIVAATGDYDSDQVDNVSAVTGASVSDALETLLAALAAIQPTQITAWATPSRGNKSMTASTTTADGNVACATAVATTPAASTTAGGGIGVRVNGVNYLVGDGTKVAVDCYFSGNGGTTARALRSVVAGDLLYWNGSVAGFELAAGTDKIDFVYDVST